MDLCSPDFGPEIKEKRKARGIVTDLSRRPSALEMFFLLLLLLLLLQLLLLLLLLLLLRPSFSLLVPLAGRTPGWSYVSLQVKVTLKLKLEPKQKLKLFLLRLLD